MKNKTINRYEAAQLKIKELDARIDKGEWKTWIGNKKNTRLLKRRNRIERKLPLLKAQSKDLKTENDWEIIEATRKAFNQKLVKYSIRAMLYLALTFYAVVTLYPFLWAFFGSFRPDNEFANAGFNPFPKHWSTEGFSYLFTNKNSHFNSWVFNSFFVCISGVIINLLLNTFAGYALARIKFKGRNQIMWVMLALVMIPAQVLLIPNYLLMKKFNLINNLMALIIPAAINIGYIFMTRQFFVNFPKEVEEASRVDGMSKVRMMFKVVMPLMRPLMITQSIFLFMGFWNNFLSAKIYLADETKYTLPVGIQSLVTQDAYKISYQQILSASTLSILPILGIYAGLNGFILKGQRTDGDK